MAQASIPLKISDGRAEATFNASIAPAGKDKLHMLLLIVKTQVVYPFLQGFAWAVFKDWLVVGRVAASAAGARGGAQIRTWLGQWLAAARHFA